MKIAHTHAVTLCVLGLVSASPVLAGQTGVNAVHTAPAGQTGVNVVHTAPAGQTGVNAASRSTSVAASGVPAKARCEVDEILGSVSCD
jgi:hypothetical protein